MKATYHNGRGGNPDHNDRHISKNTADHVDWDKTHLNRYVCLYPGMTFRQAEKKFYRETFKKYRQERNRTAKKYRHADRKKTVDSMLRNERTRPEETVIQLGDVNEQPDPNNPQYREDLSEIFNSLVQYSNEITNYHGRILDAALHMDESTPHIHIRKVWVYNDSGVYKVGQEKALERAGVPLPHPERPQSQWNNRKVTYDRMMREKLISLCLERGYKIEIETADPHRKHMNKKDYIVSQIKKARSRTRYVPVPDPEK